MGDTTVAVAGADHVTEELRSKLPSAPACAAENGLKFRLSSRVSSG
ncbi:MAG: hypothetical protein U0105_08810 [Candidatus Obscuribacterales bacterium]